MIPDQPPCPDLTEREWCDGTAHYDSDPTARPRPAVTRFCPGPARREAEARLAAERERLAALIAECPGGFAAYDPGRQPAQICARCGRPPGPDGWRCAGHRTEIARPRELAAAALAAALAFAGGRPPRRGLLLAGPLGLGKTHLLLTAHLELLAAGVRSYFVSSTDLRELFVGCSSFHEARLEEAHELRVRLVAAQAILWDDAGDVDGDERRRGGFAEGLKYLLDRSAATWAISTNLRYAQAEQHPDLGAKALSRLLKGATVIRLEGKDQRLVRGQQRFQTEAA